MYLLRTVRACAKTSRVLPCQVSAVCNVGLLLVRKFAQGSRIGILAAAVSRVCPSISVCMLTRNWEEYVITRM